VLVTVTRRPTSMSGQFTLAGLVPVSKQLRSATLIALTPSCLEIRTIHRGGDIRLWVCWGLLQRGSQGRIAWRKLAFAGVLRGLVLPSNRPYPHSGGYKASRPVRGHRMHFCSP
jgi:hypothetical protein